MTLTVCCVLRSGGVYTAEWVRRLRAAVASHLSAPHRFICLSDVDVPCERIPLLYDWPSWWAKIEAFRLPGPVLYLDLDSVIVGDLGDIARRAVSTDRMIVLRDFYMPMHFGSAVMAWSGDMRSIYQRFAADADALMVVKRPRMGDQAYIEECVGTRNATYWQDVLPGQIVSYKLDCQAGPCEVTGRLRRGGIPKGARIVSLHGEPKFSGMPVNDPVRRAWEAA